MKKYKNKKHKNIYIKTFLEAFFNTKTLSIKLKKKRIDFSKKTQKQQIQLISNQEKSIKKSM